MQGQVRDFDDPFGSLPTQEIPDNILKKKKYVGEVEDVILCYRINSEHIKPKLKKPPRISLFRATRW